MKPDNKLFRFAATSHKFGVDRTAGVITGVALITAGAEARGHGVFIDDKTISTGADALAARNGRIKCSIRHLSWEEYYATGGDRVGDYPGFFSGCAAKGNQLVAEKLEFYETFKTGEETQALYARLLEVAERTPDLIGISLELWGYAVYVAQDGTEYTERPRDVALRYDGMPALRITDIAYGSIVDEPAANPGGLYARLSRKLSDSELVATLRELFAGKPAKTPEPGAARPPAAAGSAPAAELSAADMVNSGNKDDSPAQIAMNKLIESIKAEFGADEAKFSRAMTILGKKPEISFEALKAEMQQQEFAALQAQVKDLTTKNEAAATEAAKLKTDLAAAEKERDEFKTKFEQLKASGHAGGDITLGAPSSGASDENPWLTGNLTLQCKLQKEDPKRAETLKAAAQATKAKKS